MTTFRICSEHCNVLSRLFYTVACDSYLLSNRMTQAIKRSSTWLILGHVKNLLYSFWCWRRQQSQCISDQVHHKWIDVSSSQNLKDCTIALWSSTLSQRLNGDGTEKRLLRLNPCLQFIAACLNCMKFVCLKFLCLK